MTIPFIKYSKLWVAIAAFVAGLSLLFLIMWGLKPGIDFTGGSLMEVSFSARPETGDIIKTLQPELKNVQVQSTGEKSAIIRTEFLSEEKHQKVLSDLRNEYQKGGNTVKEDRFETIGASVSRQLKERSVWAIIMVNLGIIVYIAYAFRKVSRPVASWKYGVLAIAALLHDVLLVVGVFSVLGKYLGVEVDTAFVVAILTVLGYSVNDTVVVYDRIRENVLKYGTENFADTVNIGLNQTLMRSINTTFKTLLPLVALYFVGGVSIHYFSLALLIGIASGAYSSIFIASPLLVLVHNWQNRKA